MKVNFSILREEKASGWFILDLLMVFIVLVNLGWMIFDWFFVQDLVQDFFQSHWAEFHNWYETKIHHNYLAIDGGFVAIYVFELLVRWGFSIAQKQYPKWFMYPFVRWYDVLGCLPLGSFRFLRLFRIVSMVIRLHKMRVIDIRTTWWYRLFDENYQIVSEEITDRVVVNMINTVEKEVEEGNPITSRILDEVILPKHEQIAEIITTRIQHASAEYYQKHQHELEAYVNTIVAEAIGNNEEMARLSKIPVVGKQLNKTIDSVVGDVTYRVIDQILVDLSKPNSPLKLQELTDEMVTSALTDEETQQQIKEVTTGILTESLGLIKEKVKEQEWRKKVR